MALHNDWGEHNQLVETLPVIRYGSVPKLYTPPTGAPYPIYWTLTRTSSQSFRFIGMTMDAARRCADALREQYTLPYMNWSAEVNSDDPAKPTVRLLQASEIRCSASIQPSRVAGDNWEVAVQVEDSDVVVATVELKTSREMEDYFQKCSQRKILSGQLSIYGARWSLAFGGMTEIDFVQDIYGFDLQKLSVVYKRVSSPGEWEEIPASSFLETGEGRVSVALAANYPVKLRYTDGESVIESDEVEPTVSETVSLETRSLSVSTGDTEPPAEPSQWYFQQTAIECVVECEIDRAKFRPYETGNWKINFLGVGLSFTPETVDAESDGGFRIRYSDSGGDPWGQGGLTPEKLWNATRRNI